MFAFSHKTAGGRYAGAVRYQYTTGPDRQSYIVGGEVSIDTSEAKTPEETLQKMEQVKAAALAPADPSPQDYSVASTAETIEQKARYELMKASYEMSSPQTGKRVDTYA
ncbi:MAG TPA: putative metalloprotease CJM1_0395 family protein [Syntrophorhabdales bacterium]|nr:putative metalloprotease CJM1_0395 family protein [Syntrophorhabdales bacterium]